jgi:DNA (cytosine-5)-methyltransferase 1
MNDEAPGKRKYSVISLFSGAMGLDLGLEATGRFEVVACIEKEHAICETIRTNQKKDRLSNKLQVLEADITDVDPSEVIKSCGIESGDLDLLVGGPPCQSFSTAGRRRTTQDARGSLLWQFLRFIQVIRPRFFLMENVRGLLSAAIRHRPIARRPENGGPPLSPDEEPGSVVRLFAEDLRNVQDGAYQMDCFEVNAVNYGAPQLRERALFIGNRYNAGVDFPQPTHGAPDQSNRKQWLFGHLEPWQTLRNVIGSLQDPSPVIMDFSPRKKRYLRMVPPGSNWRSLPIETQKESMGIAWYAKGGKSGWWRRLSYDLPCPTLVTMPNHAGTALCHPSEVRALTLREYALIQEFPPDWEFCGSPAQQYAQAGNAVPTRLGRVAGEVIAQELDRLRERGYEPYPGGLSSCRIIYLQSHVRTRQWFKNGRTFVWQGGDQNVDAAYSSPKTKKRMRTI